MYPSYPLRWPKGVQRKTKQRQARFSSGGSSVSVATAIQRLQREVDLLGATNYCLTSNLQPRLDGLPRSNQPEPADKGVAVWFTRNGKTVCFPCDSFDRAADNIAAIAAHLDALRRIERFGVATVSQLVQAFETLPAVIPAGKATDSGPVDWWIILGVDVTASQDEVKAAFRNLAMRHKGDDQKTRQLIAARDEAKKFFEAW